MLRYANYLSTKLLVIFFYFLEKNATHTEETFHGSEDTRWPWRWRGQWIHRRTLFTTQPHPHEPPFRAWSQGSHMGLAGGAGFPWPIKLLTQKYQAICHQSESLGWWSRNVPASVSNTLCSWESPFPSLGLGVFFNKVKVAGLEDPSVSSQFYDSKETLGNLS